MDQGVLSVPSARVVELESSSVMRTQSSSVVTHGESDRGSRRGRAQTEKQTRHAVDTSSGADPLASREHCEGAAIEAVFGGNAGCVSLLSLFLSDDDSSFNKGMIMWILMMSYKWNGNGVPLLLLMSLPLRFLLGVMSSSTWLIWLRL